LNTSPSLIHNLKKNKPALIALIVIVLTGIIALFAYPLSPDKTPLANNMIVELSAKPAGFKMKFLLLPKHREFKEESKLKELFYGYANPNNYLPISHWYVTNDSIHAIHYIDKGLTDTLSFNYNQLKIPKDITLSSEWIEKNLITEKIFYLGTDRYGRDILSRIIVGTRVSISVGIIAVVLSLSIGIFLGSIAGWYGGWIDNLVMWLVNLLWSIPTLLLVFAITITIGKGFWEIFIAIGLTSWVSTARLIRGQVMQIKEGDFITAAKTLGIPDGRIIFKHILPNIAGPIMVIAAANFAAAILIEAGLSFLGIGVQPPTPSWGLMIKEHYNFLIAGNPLPALVPGIAIMILVLAFNIVGNGLRDAIDVKDNS
jgi:ABC-type dipeptide/oligopeptide/nickel transport system permease subunit